jgi:hypothetical protein
MRIDAYLLRLPDDIEFWRLTADALSDEDRGSFLHLGLYDEIWQRDRTDGAGGGPVARARRGYVEVLL